MKVLMSDGTFIHFLIFMIISSFVVEHHAEQFTFSEKKVKSVHLRKVAKYKYRRLYEEEKLFLDMSSEKRRTVCLQARDHILLPRGYSESQSANTEFPVAEAHLYKIDGVNFVAIRCPTIPPIFVSPRIGSTQLNDFLLLIIKSPFCRRCTFNLEVARFISPVSPEDYSVQQLYAHHFATVDAEGRWHLCKRARKFIRRVFVFHGGEIQEPRLYEFDYGVRKERHVAIKCPSKPSFYLRYRETLRTEKEMRIILVELE